MPKFDLTSVDNPLVRKVVKLRADKRQRRHDRLFVVEGRAELTMALSTGVQPQTILLAPELISPPSVDVEVDPLPRHLTVSRRVFEKMSYRENPDGWLAVFPVPEQSLIGFKLKTVPLILVVETVEKPGNLGAMFRTADAAGVDCLLITDPRVDLWNPNVIRASRGAVFSVPAIEVGNSAALDWLKTNKIMIVSAAIGSGTNYTNVNYRLPAAFVVGTEDVGLSEFWLANADQRVNIPMSGRVNSLNVSVASALLIYEALRQRS